MRARCSVGKSFKKNAKYEQLNPDKISRGHKFAKVGRSATFKSKKDYDRKNRTNKPSDESEYQ